jgi:hypothetical protein
VAYFSIRATQARFPLQRIADNVASHPLTDHDQAHPHRKTPAGDVRPRPELQLDGAQLRSQPLRRQDEAVVRKVRAIGTHEIYIDTARGLDLPEAPTREEIEHEVDEKIDAIAAEAAPRIAAQEVACEIERARNAAPRGQSRSFAT